MALVYTSISCAGEGSRNSRSNSNSEATSVKVSNVDSGHTRNKVIASQDDNNGATPEQLAKAKEMIEANGDVDYSKINAKKIFKNYCAICHGFKGDMNINGAKDLTVSKITLEDRVAQVYFGKGLMTPFKGVLKDHEIIAVGQYVETLRK